VPDLFETLNDQHKFCEFVREHFVKAPKEISAVMACDHQLSDARIEYAFNEYQQNLATFSVLLHSANPDHYKRAGALLHALSNAKIVEGIKFESSPEDLAAGFTRVTNGDAEQLLPYVEFYQDYYNQTLAFNLAYKCCAAYEANPRDYDFDYLHNVCHYLRLQSNLSLDSCFMIFKSLMI